MHLLENYALQTGLKIKTPHIQQKFFPMDIPYDKIILLHGSAGGVNNNQAMFPSKIYDYFNEVVEQLTPYLIKHGFYLVQIGAANEQPIRGVKHLMGKTTIAQTAFLIKNCALLIGNDSINSHIASALGTPSIILFGPTSVREHGAFWKTNKNISIESHRFGNKPSFSAYEHSKTINVIPPEQIVSNVLSVLELSEVHNISSKFIGQSYNAYIFEFVPNCNFNLDVPKEVPLIVRMDLCFNEQILAQTLRYKKCQIISRHPINIEIIKGLKQNIVSCIFYADEISTKYIEEIKKAGVSYVLISENEETLNDLRFKFYDFGHVELARKTKKEEFIAGVKKYTNNENLLEEDLKISKLLFKSNKFIFSEGKVFLSQAHFEENIPNDPNGNAFAEVIDKPSFWKDLNHYYIYSNV